VDTLRDLAQVDPWQESLERSLARRGKSTRSSLALDHLPPERDVTRDHESVQEPATKWPSRPRVPANRQVRLIVSAGVIFALALLATTLPSVFDGGRAQASATAAKANVSRPSLGSRYADSRHAPASPGGAGVAGTRSCQLAVRSSGYVNPLAGASVMPERIDQGVDYAGSGTLTAIGAGRVTNVATSDTGWPGAFIEYQLFGGVSAGCYVYYAEGVSPAAGLRVGQTVRAGQLIATIIPGYSSGIEIGWGAGAGNKTYAAAMGEWSTANDEDSIPTTAGKSFSALIASLGGPPGRVEG
jgi:murein DD-endopeptidase MepM/ murein hydrolase activator NlpD